MDFYFFLVLSVFGLLVLILLIIILAKHKKSDTSIIGNSLITFEKKIDTYEKNLKDEFERNRKESAENSSATRIESTETLVKFQESINTKFDTLTKHTQEAMTSNLTNFTSLISERLDSLSKLTQDNLIKQRETVQASLKNIQDSNEQKLEKMRETVDEKLQSTLEKRLTNSFELVSKQLEAVQKGLGEMQNLANDVGGLKRALTNVKSAGAMGEVQLEAILNDFLSVEQFEKNAHPNPSKPNNVVEFAVKLPSKGADKEFIYLPIDSKYPAVLWDKLTLAYENAEKEEIETLRKDLENQIKKMAKDINDKYIEVPYTTDFAILFVPFESMYAEINRIPGFVQTLQNELKITIAGPSTLTAFLNSLQMGFRTLTIQKETSKVWDLLGAVKTEFGKFGTVLTKTKEKLKAATNEIENAERRSRVIEKKLTNIEALPEKNTSTNLLEFDNE